MSGYNRAGAAAPTTIGTGHTVVGSLKAALFTLNAMIEAAHDAGFAVKLGVTRGGLARLTIQPPDGGRVTIEIAPRTI